MVEDIRITAASKIHNPKSTINNAQNEIPNAQNTMPSLLDVAEELLSRYGEQLQNKEWDEFYVMAKAIIKLEAFKKRRG